jgi:hypothetical protein
VRHRPQHGQALRGDLEAALTQEIRGFGWHAARLNQNLE